jgi:hypothetical protein
MAISEQQLQEISDGSQALIDWFISQETSAAMTGAIMANTIASILVATAKSEDHLNDLYEEFGKLVQARIDGCWQMKQETRRK